MSEISAQELIELFRKHNYGAYIGYSSENFSDVCLDGSFNFEAIAAAINEGQLVE